MIISDIIKHLEAVFPLNTALEGDNVGLQVGHISEDIQRVFVALTLTDRALQQALNLNASLIITHHPLIYRPLRSIDVSTPLGRRIQNLIKQNVSVYSAHTNLDVAVGGVSDALADVYGLRDRRVLLPTHEYKLLKLIVYVPVEAFDRFREQFLQGKVGHIGNYSQCSFSLEGEGTFRPEEGSTPYSGNHGEMSTVKEKRFEAVLWEKDTPSVIETLKELHPYEEVAYDLIPLSNTGQVLGLGRYGTIDPLCRIDFPMPISGIFKGDLGEKKIISRVGVSGGSGGKLVADAVRLGLDLFISAEFSFHDELLAAEHGLTLLDLGHDASERPILEPLAALIRNRFPELDVRVEEV